MDRLPLHRTALLDSAAREHRRRRRRGEAIRVGYGITTPHDMYRAASESVRHRARIEAVVSRSRPGLIVSHESAVVLHDLPWFGELPERVILTDTSRDRAQRLRFSDKVPARGRSLDVVTVDGILTTDLVTTGVDLALRSDRGHAMVVVDAVLRRGVDQDELLSELGSRQVRRGTARARKLIELGDPRTESPGESLTKLIMHDLGLPAPMPQHEFHDGSRLLARVDFWFPDAGVVVEFDGLSKYRDRALRGARSAEDVVVSEKIREDAVRRVRSVTGFARLVWPDVMPGGSAPSVLARAGLPVPSTIRRTPTW